MVEWIVERGIGEIRAARIEGGRIVAARIEPDGHGLRVGTVADARLIERGPYRAVVRIGADEALLEPPPPGVTEGAALRVEILREAIPEPGRPKRARARLTDEAPMPGPDLAARVVAAGQPLTPLAPRDPDRLEAAGWSETLEAALSGEVAFDGGALRISPTPAMTLIDVDGDAAPEVLALAAARAAAGAITLLDIGGSIGIDFPTVAGREARRAVGAALDAALPPPFERTALNGFGFLQIVRPRPRASLMEILRADPVSAAARGLLRRAERSRVIGAARLIAAPSVIAVIRPEWIAVLADALGGPIALQADPTLPISAGHVAKA